MGESINKEYEDFQKYLEKKERKLKLLVEFNLDEDIDEVIKEINKKEIIFNETNRR
jgi:hypothetical protein